VTIHWQNGRLTALLVRWLAVSVLIVTAGWYMIFMPGKSWSDQVPPLSAEEQLIHDNLKRHVVMLAQQIGERNVWNAQALLGASRYIRQTLENLGYRVRVQSFESAEMTVQNLEVELPGVRLPQEVIVFGAHYDSVLGTPGANDNASGIAALLEIARLMAGKKPARTLRLVAFANEEAPFFDSDEMGSKVYAKRASQRNEDIKAMVSLEMIGYYSDKRGSQRYPFPFSIFYPDTANFVGFVGNLSSRRLVRQALGAFRASTAFPSEGLAAPSWVTGVAWSDHWSFWQVGYPAIMITDTAFFRYEHYHRPTDTSDKLDYQSMARVTRGLLDVAIELAGH
jgi:hypothetical protein